jgi:hypothetical protein
MELALLTYAYFLLNSFKELAMFTLVIYGCYVAISMVILAISYGDSYNKPDTFKEYFSTSFLKGSLYPKTFGLLLLVAMLIPTQETAKWIVGAYATGTAASYLATNEQTAKLPGNVLSATNKFLEEFNNRTSPKPTE